MKTGKELKINNFKNYNVVFGSVNNKHPKAVYINISAWAEPRHKYEINYVRAIRDVNKKVKQTLFDVFDSTVITEFKKNRTIVDLDIRESGIRYGKRSFMNCEITLFLNTEIPLNSDRMKVMLDEVVALIIESTFENSRTFNFHKKKI